MNNESTPEGIKHVLLNEVLTKGIQRNDEQCKIWTAYKIGHEKVAAALCTFQNDLYVNCMVPLGKRALIKGKLIHTNEVLACLGDGYFAKYSATNAIALCKRRIQRSEEMLKNLNAERDLYETRMMVAETDLFEDSSGAEVIEHWSDDQITEWKLKHREKERQYHQRLAKLRQEEKKKVETEEDLFQRLDQLEIEEDLADEMNRLEDERRELYGVDFEEEEYYYESESSSETEEENSETKIYHTSDTEKKSEENVGNNKIKKSVSFPGLDSNTYKQIDDNLKEGKDVPNENTEGSEEDIFRIEFVHSQNEPVNKSHGDSIETPADIYRILSKPKSILKKSSHDIIPQQIAPLDDSAEEEEDECVKTSAYESVVKDIIERDTTSLKNDTFKKDTATQQVSKFKRDRQRKQ